MAQAIRARKANKISDITKLDRNKVAGFSAHNEVKMRDVETVNPLRLRKKEKTARRKEQPKATFSPMAPVRLDGNCGFHRQTQDKSQG
jgi:hypothetical protein